MIPSPRTISRQKGVEVCTELLFSGRKAGDIIRECGEKYGVKRSAVEKWMQLARPKVEIMRQEADIVRRKAIEEEVAEAARKLNITREGMLDRLWRIANGNIQDFFHGKTNMIPVKDLPRETSALLASVEVDELYYGSGESRYHVGQTKKIRLLDPLRAMDMINKMQGWYKEDDKGPSVNLVIGYGKEVPV